MVNKKFAIFSQILLKFYFVNIQVELHIKSRCFLHTAQGQLLAEGICFEGVVVEETKIFKLLGHTLRSSSLPPSRTTTKAFQSLTIPFVTIPQETKLLLENLIYD